MLHSRILPRKYPSQLSGRILHYFNNVFDTDNIKQNKLHHPPSHGGKA